MSDVIVEATRETFKDLVAEGTVLVDVWGPDCRPCLALLPHVEALAEKYAGEVSVIKLEAPKARRLCMDLGIMGMPAFLLFRDGTEVARLADPALSPLRLNQWLDSQREGVS
jgi:thioredoxin-like negative regulator of GroEL